MVARIREILLNSFAVYIGLPIIVQVFDLDSYNYLSAFVPLSVITINIFAWSFTNVIINQFYITILDTFLWETKKGGCFIKRPKVLS